MISKRISNILCDKECLDKAAPHTIMHLKTAVSMKILNSHDDLLKDKNAAETFYGLICRLAPTLKSTLAKYFCDS